MADINVNQFAESLNNKADRDLLNSPQFLALKADAGVESKGDNWIRYTNGLQVCWGGGNLTSGNNHFSFPVAFNRGQKLAISQSNTNDMYMNTSTISPEGFIIYGSKASSGAFNYIAIGWWR